MVGYNCSLSWISRGPLLEAGEPRIKVTCTRDSLARYEFGVCPYPYYHLTSRETMLPAKRTYRGLRTRRRGCCKSGPSTKLIVGSPPAGDPPLLFMARAKRPLDETDGNVARAPAPKKPSIGTKASAEDLAPESESEAESASIGDTHSRSGSPLAVSAVLNDKSEFVYPDVDDKLWICLCDKGLAKDFLMFLPDKTCICRKHADRHPKHKAIMTWKGVQFMEEWIKQ